MFLKPGLLTIAAGSLVLSGCVIRETRYQPAPPPPVVVQQPAPPPDQAVGSEVVVSEAPPPPIVEQVTVAPAPGFIWIGGYWAWRGHWVWVHGRWGRPPRAGMVWVPHRYVYRNGVHVYVRGGWRF